MKQEQQTFSFGDHISQDQLDFFNRRGYIQFRNFIGRDELRSIQEEIARVQKFLIRNQITRINGIPLKYGKDIDGSPLIQRIAFTSRFSVTLQDFLNQERLQLLKSFLSNYEGRIGEAEKDGLVLNHYLNTGDSEYTRLGWHTDSPRDLFMGSRIMPMLNVGLHLDDCPADNGGLRVLAGTHKQNIFRLLFRKKYFVDHRPDKNETGFDISAGDLTVHDGRLWHRVQQSPYTGEASRRRVLYIPVVTGAYQPKNHNSPTPFYHRLGSIGQINPFKTGKQPIREEIKQPAPQHLRA
jgi:phytanoyl-CoA hydroxylase